MNHKARLVAMKHVLGFATVGVLIDLSAGPTAGGIVGAFLLPLTALIAAIGLLEWFLAWSSGNPEAAFGPEAIETGSMMLTNLSNHPLPVLMQFVTLFAIGYAVQTVLSRIRDRLESPGSPTEEEA